MQIPGNMCYNKREKTGEVRNMAVADRKTDQDTGKFSGKSVLSGLFGSNIRETVADIRAIRAGFKRRKQAKLLKAARRNR